LLWFFIVRDKIYKLPIYSMLDNMLITLFIKKPTKKFAFHKKTLILPLK
jgi:hypothetical protein